MRFPLPLKFFLFAAAIAIAPLALVGENLVRIARDELISAANEDLTQVAAELRTSFDATYRGRWLAPLAVIRNGIDNPELGVAQKVSLLTLGLQEMPDVIALQLTLEGSSLPMLVTDQKWSDRLTDAGADPVKALATSPDLITAILGTGQASRPLISRLEPTGNWIATLAMPLEGKIAGRDVTLAARIDLAPLAETLRRHPFQQRGEITVVDHAGRRMLGNSAPVLADRAIVAKVMPLIVAGARADALESYTRRDGTEMLGAYAFPDWFPWAVITELSEAQAYGVVNQMTERVVVVGLIGFALASLAALAFSRRLTGPILRIGRVAGQIGEGDFTARVTRVASRDEIGDLARRINVMAAQLGERLELMKFVSHGTMQAIQDAESRGMSRGGARRRVAVIFTDIRGYTEFSESVAPEVVIDMLNQYFDAQAGIVEAHDGDIDKFIGDALVAVFEGADRETRATRCGLEIIAAMARLLAENPQYGLGVGIGIASGEVVRGAMGAKDRMDFTVLGSTVNLAARLCSKAAPGQVLADAATFAAAGDSGARFEPLDPISLKGYAEPVPAYSVTPA